MTALASAGVPSGRPAELRAHDLGFRYQGAPRPALDGVGFELAAGQCLLVLGPSGSGKSTLALAIAGLVPREIPGTWRGSLKIDGTEISGLGREALGARVGIVFQDPRRQLVMDRVDDDVAFGLENRAWPVDAMRIRVPEVLAEVGLHGLERRRPTTLSGGQQQRLALAGVLAPEPGVLVFDEPTGSLDPDGTSALFDRLAAIRERRAATIVLVEHRVELAWPLADRILALGLDGRPIDEGRPDEVLARSGARMRDAGIWLPAVAVAWGWRVAFGIGAVLALAKASSVTGSSDATSTPWRPLAKTARPGSTCRSSSHRRFPGDLHRHRGGMGHGREVG